MQGEKKYSILIPDGNSELLTVVINCLSQNKDYVIYIILNRQVGDITYSKYIKNIFLYDNLDETNEKAWIDNINNIVEAHKIDIIMPIDVTAIRCLSQHRKQIVKSNTLGLLPPFENFDTADDKAELSKHLTLYNIPAPKTFLYEKGGICNESPVGFPVILKLFENIGGGDGVFIFNDNESLKNFFLNSRVNHGYLMQDYIEGYDIDCSVLCDQGNILAYTIQKGIMKGANDFTPQLGVEFLFEKALYEVVEKLMVSLNWSGVAHIDMRYDVKDENFKVIEINPRFWGSLDASLIAGVNFTHFYCLASKSIKFDLPKYDNVRFLNLVGLNKAFKKNKLFLFKFKFLLNNTPLKFFKKNPLPLIYIIIYKIKNDIKSIFS